MRLDSRSGLGEQMAEDFLYFTELLGLPVYDLKHRRIGRVGMPPSSR